MSIDALTWIAFATSIVFGVLSIYFYFRSKRIKRLACLFGAVTLQKRSHPDVKIEFRGHEIEDLSRMVVFIWNSGTTDVRATDIPPDNWPMLNFSEGTRVLSVAVLFTSTDHIDFDAQEFEDRAVQFKFGYLNPGDGAVIEVLFERNAQPLSPEFTAPLIGGSAPNFEEFPARFRKDVWLSLLEAAGGLISGIGFATWFAPQAQGSVAGYLLATALFIGGLSTTIVANYIDLRRLHRRLPAFAQQYFKRIAA